MIGWHSDNHLSKTVLQSIPDIDLRHIKDFYHNADETHCFYGLLRGASNAMHVLKHTGRNYYYIDNGYFDALYVDKNMHKSMEGKFRIVKNGMHEVYPNDNAFGAYADKVLVIPPSPYSANFYDTTPEDWVQTTCRFWPKYKTRIRAKGTLRTLEEDLDWCGCVKAFNSMAVMKAVEMGLPVSDTHGIFRRGFSIYNMDALRDFYEPKQYTLQEFKEGKCVFT